MPIRSFGRSALLVLSLLGLLAIFSQSALAAGPPVVTATGATNKTLHTATLNGTVNPNGASSSVTLEYGKTKLYGQTVALGSLNGSSALPVSKIVAGLDPITTYHYRISATNSFGTTVSEDSVFEMLLQWKVGGKSLSELIYGPVSYYTWAEKAKLTVKNTAFTITCDMDYPSNGVIGDHYTFYYKNCRLANSAGKEAPVSCPPQSFTLELGAKMVPVKDVTLNYGEECALAEEIKLPLTSGGFEVGPIAEALTIEVDMVENLSNMTINITGTKWSLASPYNAFKFGIS
jgi:hypothetical protein